MERRLDNEVREALLGVVVRMVDEYRVGIRDLVIDDVRSLVEAWSELNQGESPAELRLNLLARLGGDQK